MSVGEAEGRHKSWRVTVTDRRGGRGTDYRVDDSDVDGGGGLRRAIRVDLARFPLDVHSFLMISIIFYLFPWILDDVRSIFSISMWFREEFHGFSFTFRSFLARLSRFPHDFKRFEVPKRLAPGLLLIPAVALSLVAFRGLKRMRCPRPNESGPSSWAARPLASTTRAIVATTLRTIIVITIRMVVI